MAKHTAFSLRIEQRVLWVTANGFWTKAIAQQYVREMRSLVLPISAKPWAVVLDIRQWEISPAEVFSLLNENTVWCFDNNLKHVETIGADNTMVMWQFAKATQAVKPADVVSTLKDDELAARQSLRAAGYLF
ncbi:hypothetical protein [Alishewanella sp. HL-SH05]|uniref:hypothetical protein n=1 Tax=Alishewanella sp. HL-SH05 TaxID=3461145 RepID=UPI0040419AA8